MPIHISQYTQQGKPRVLLTTDDPPIAIHADSRQEALTELIDRLGQRRAEMANLMEQALDIRAADLSNEHVRKGGAGEE